MLLRFYRITDRIGLLVLKSADILDAWLRGSSASLLVILRRLLGLIGLIFSAILGLVTAILRLVGLLLRKLVSLIAVVLRVFGIGGRRVIDTGTQRVSQSMARRAAKADLDVVVTEDPLRIQNRRLSFLVLILGAFAVGAVLYATDPARTASPTLGNSRLGLPIQVTPPLTEPAVSQDAGIAVAAIATPIPTITPVPEILQVGGTIAFTVRERGQSDIWAVPIGSRQPLRLLSSSVDDRDPEWNLQGDRLAFASRRDGNWDLYFYDLGVADQVSGTQRLTFDLAFQANPSWSDDGLWVVFESYQTGNLDIIAQRIDGSEIVPITTDPAPDFSPVWSPTGREIAFVSWRDGNQDIYVFDLDSREVTNLTQTPDINEDHPAWSRDGAYLAYSGWDQGREKVYTLEVSSPGTGSVIAVGRTPVWSPDGLSLAYITDSTDAKRSFLYVVPHRVEGPPLLISEVPAGATSPTWTERVLPPAVINSGGVDLAVQAPLYEERVERRAAGAPIGLQPIANVQIQQAFLSDAVNESYNAMRERLVEETGWDFLAQVDELFWGIDRQPEPSDTARNWHKTGRAFSIDRGALLGFPPDIEVVREERNPDGSMTWRVFIRVDEDLQSGRLGEPLRQMPWDFLSRVDIEAFNQGGRLRTEMPAGYYVDFTQIASDYGWLPRPAGSDWRANANTRFFWMFYKPDGLDWLDAMLEIYLSSQLGGFAPTPQAAAN